MMNRIMKRSQHSGRSDDNLATFEKRMNTYEQNTIPVINHYRAENKLRTVLNLD